MFPPPPVPTLCHLFLDRSRLFLRVERTRSCSTQIAASGAADEAPAITGRLSLRNAAAGTSLGGMLHQLSDKSARSTSSVVLVPRFAPQWLLLPFLLSFLLSALGGYPPVLEPPTRPDLPRNRKTASFHLHSTTTIVNGRGIGVRGEKGKGKGELLDGTTNSTRCLC